MVTANDSDQMQFVMRNKSQGFETERDLAIVWQSLPVALFRQIVRTQSSTVGSGGANMPGAANGTLPNTLPVVTDGTAYSVIDTTITPLSASSNLLVQVDLPMIAANAAAVFTVALFRDSTANAVTCACEHITNALFPRHLHLSALVPAASTEATTFRIRYGDIIIGGATLYVGQLSSGAVLGGGLLASMTITEITG